MILETKKNRRLSSIGIILLMFVPICIAAFFRDVTNVDELWNYNFANNICKGQLPYRDFNLLQTPFSCLVNAGFLSVFGKYIVSIRFAGVLLFLGVSLLLYRESRLMGAGRIASLVVPFAFVTMFFWDIFFEYNVLILLFLLSAMVMDLISWQKRKRQRAVSHIFIGILMGLAIMSKQTYGFFVAAASVIVAFLTAPAFADRSGKGKRQDFVEKHDITEDDNTTEDSIQKSGTLKLRFRAALLRILGIAIPCMVFLIYLLVTDTFGNFLDMCLYGIREFSGVYAYSAFMMENPAYFLGGLLFPALVIVSIIVAIRTKHKNKRMKLVICLVYSISGCISLYPLANSYHVALSAIPFLPLIFQILPKRFLVKKLFIVVETFAVVAMTLFLSVIVPVINCRKAKLCVEGFSHYAYTFMDKSTIEDLKDVVAYVGSMKIQGWDVYILDNYASFYLIPLNIYHNGLDMFLLGNLGTKPPGEWIREAEEKGNAIFLTPEDGRGNWQFPWEALNEAKKRWRKGKNIGEFDIYFVH